MPRAAAGPRGRRGAGGGGRALRRALLAAGLALLALPGGAAAGGLPSVSSGQRPGPPLLYADPPSAPQLSVQAPFAAQPLLVSGTDALRGGEYLYQDYLFDDHGANTVPGLGTQPPGTGSFSPSAGDIAYPDEERFANNAADIVEVRVRPTEDAVVFRITFNTVRDAAVPIATVAIDTDRAGGQGDDAWPRAAGLTTPGVEHFVTAWDGGGEVTHTGGDAAQEVGSSELDPDTNQLTVSVPKSVLDPGTGTWRLTAGAGLRGGGDTYREVAPGPVPEVFNLAFRFDEPQSTNPAAGAGTFPGVGNFFEDGQAKALASGKTDGIHADVDFGALAAGTATEPHPPGRKQARIMPSGLDLPEGVRSRFPQFGGKLQPYLLRVPEGVGDPSRPAGLTFSMHSLGGTYTQYAVFSPRQLTQFGDERANLVATPLGHGPDGWYTDQAEVDFFEVWRDVAQHFQLDPERTYPTGYSMGGYGTYKLGTEYPDLFARAFTTVGPPGLGVWPVVSPPIPGGQDTLTTPKLQNTRWLPYLNWVGAQDQLVPYVGPTAQQDRFDALKLRSELWTFQSDHFGLAVLDQWGAARDFLGPNRRQGDPSRVNYVFVPAADRVELGLRHDHAYWVSELRARSTAGDPNTNPASGEVDARSLAFGEGDPATAAVSGAVTAGTPSPAVRRGTRWTGLASQPKENALELSLRNTGSARLDGRRARLDGTKRLRVKVGADGAGRLRLDLPLPAGARVERTAGQPLTRAAAPEVQLDRAGASFTLGSGTREYVITTESADATEPGDDDPDGSGSGDDDPGGGGPSEAAGSVSPGSGDGTLPFTGFLVALLLLAAALLLLGGKALRRHS